VTHLSFSQKILANIGRTIRAMFVQQSTLKKAMAVGAFSSLPEGFQQPAPL
jgi:DNA-binding transcriptional regulator WhiA